MHIDLNQSLNHVIANTKRLEKLLLNLETHLVRLEDRLHRLERVQDRWNAGFAVCLGLGSFSFALAPQIFSRLF